MDQRNRPREDHCSVWYGCYGTGTSLLFSEQKMGHFEMCVAPAPEYNGPFHLFLVTFIFFCCWILYIIVSISQATTMVSCRWTFPLQMQTISAWLAPLNSAINPLFYALWSKRWRKALKNLKEKTLFKIHFLIQDVLVSQSENAKKKSRKKGFPMSCKQHIVPFKSQQYIQPLATCNLGTLKAT